MEQQRSVTPTLQRTSSTKQIRNEKIRVIVRVRPSIPEDLHPNPVDEWCVQIPDMGDRDGKAIVPPDWYDADRVRIPYTPFIRLRRTMHERRDFRFDAVLPHFTTQEDTYEIVARQRINDVLNGVNASIIMYGQTGSGKSYTSFGPPDDPLLTGVSRSNQVLTSHSGLVPRAISEIFNKLNESTIPYTATLSYVQIYKDQIFDLLSNLDANVTTNHLLLPLQIREDKGGIFVNNVTHLPVYQAANVFAAIMFAAKRRAVAATQMNSNSSRSHVLLTLTVERRYSMTTKRGVLTFVDLAGSERVSKTMSDGERLSEAKKINQSLSALGNCVVALSTNRSFVPFRDSPLTRLLTESLSGNSKTLIVATIGPSSYNYDESYSTLQFATRCMSLRTNFVANATPRASNKSGQGIAYDSSIAMTTLGDFAVMEDEEDEKITCLASQCPRCGVHLTILPRNAVESFAQAMSLQEGKEELHDSPVYDQTDDASSCYSELSANRVSLTGGIQKDVESNTHESSICSPNKHAALVENYKKLIASLQETIRVLESENRAQKEALYCVQELFKGSMRSSVLRQMIVNAMGDETTTPSVPYVEIDDNVVSRFGSLHAAGPSDHMEGGGSERAVHTQPLYDSDLYDSYNRLDPTEIQLPVLDNRTSDIVTTVPTVPTVTKSNLKESNDEEKESPLLDNVLSSYLDEELPQKPIANSLLLSTGLSADKKPNEMMAVSAGGDRAGGRSAILISNEYIRSDSLGSSQKTCKLLSPSSKAPLPVIIPKFRSKNKASILVQERPSSEVRLNDLPEEEL
ncbi:Kinesin like protein [Giardia lamblia P15]|uniref:Kinesin-like protein n=1 Tax=Giardia intestinalis (strain P15) TaxID=658858 RepID=E1EX11_GIAIA|nr:Kinesin like protein [Giardia lamblia P15]